MEEEQTVMHDSFPSSGGSMVSNGAGTASHSDFSGLTTDPVHERAARARAEAALFARDRILSIASHDLRGPLNAIQSWVHVIERKLDSAGAADPALQRAIGGIRTGVDQQVGLIERIIDATRASTKSLAVAHDSFPLKALVDDVLTNLRVTFADPRGVALEAQVELPAAQRMNGDRERVWQALWVLGAYAIDGSARGACVMLRTWIEAGEWRTGVGWMLDAAALTDDTRPHAFEHFCRIDATASAPHDLGWYLPRRVAEAHGGKCEREAGTAGRSALTMSWPV